MTAYEVRISDCSSDVCSSKLRAARLSLVGRGARLNVGANVLGGKIKEEESAAGRRRGTFAHKGIRTRAHQFADAALFPRPACHGCASLTRATWPGNEHANAGRGIRSEQRRVGKEGVRTCQKRRSA